MAQAKSDKSSQSSGGSQGIDGSSKGFMLVVLGLVVVGLAAVAFVVGNSGGDEVAESAAAGTENASSDGAETATVEVVGETLPPMPEGVRISDASNDAAAGTVAPTITGTGFDGSEVTIGPDGRAKAVYFVAHWCPHCQEEVPLVQGLVDQGTVPADLDVYAVSTAVNSGQGNFPPSAWLAEEGFTPMTMRDDETSTAFAGFGGGSFPYVVYLDADNQVVARSAGSLDAETTTQLWELAAG